MGLRILAELVLETEQPVRAIEWRRLYQDRFGTVPPANVYERLKHPFLLWIPDAPAKGERRSARGRPARRGLAWLPTDVARRVIEQSTYSVEEK